MVDEDLVPDTSWNESEKILLSRKRVPGIFGDSYQYASIFVVCSNPLYAVYFQGKWFY